MPTRLLGTVEKARPICLLLTRVACAHVLSQAAVDPLRGNEVQAPKSCPNPNDVDNAGSSGGVGRGRGGWGRGRGRGGSGAGGVGGNSRKCASTTFAVEPSGHTCQDYQEIKIQEHVQRLSIGSIPRSIKVVLSNDLVDRCQAGDDIVVVGVVRDMWLPPMRDQRCELELYIDANHLTVYNSGRVSTRRCAACGAFLTPCVS